MKIIFLDHDGVICLMRNWGSRFTKQRNFKRKNPGAEVPSHVKFDNFDSKAVTVLNRILEKTDAEIVISSDWKMHANLETLKQIYIQQKIVKLPIDVTPELDEYARFKIKKREKEIENWLKGHPEVTHWVAIDDLFLNLSNFVHTPISNEGIKQSGVEDKILKYLNP